MIDSHACISCISCTVCTVCGFVYDEAIAMPEEGIAVGTKWSDVPDDWECPDCGAAKAGFEPVEL